MMLTFAIIAGSWLLLSIFTFYENGQRPHEKKKAKKERESLDSLTTKEDSTISKRNHVSVREQVKILIADKCYISMFLAAGIVFGSFGGIGVAINLVMSVWGYNELFGSICVVTGIVSGILFSILYAVFFLEKRGQLRNYQILMILS